MPGIRDVLAAALERAHKPAARQLSFREEQGFQRDAKLVHGGAERHEAPVEPRAARDRRGEAVGGEPRRPAHLLVVALDQRVAEQVVRRPYRGREARRTKRRHDLGAERQDDHALLSQAAIVVRRGRAVDDVSVELVGEELRVIRARREPQLEPGAFRQEPP